MRRVPGQSDWNLRDWMAQENNVYIGRRGIVFVNTESGKVRWPPEDSIWSNPFHIGKEYKGNALGPEGKRLLKGKILDREQVLCLYRTYIEKKIREEPEIYNLETLRGKQLGCWCKPEPCHGDILLGMLLEMKSF
jgi:hypothetical protein